MSQLVVPGGEFALFTTVVVGFPRENYRLVLQIDNFVSSSPYACLLLSVRWVVLRDVLVQLFKGGNSIHNNIAKAEIQKQLVWWHSGLQLRHLLVIEKASWRLCILWESAVCMGWMLKCSSKRSNELITIPQTRGMGRSRSGSLQSWNPRTYLLDRRRDVAQYPTFSSQGPLLQ